MGMYGEEEVVVGLGENVLSGIGQDVAGVSNVPSVKEYNATADATLDAAKGSLSTTSWVLIASAGILILGIVVGLIIFMYKKKKSNGGSELGSFVDLLEPGEGENIHYLLKTDPLELEEQDEFLMN